MATEQLDTGVLRTSRPDGETTYDASHALSKLPTNVRSSDLLSSSFSEQAEASKTASIQDQKAYDQSISNAVSDFSSLGNTLGSNKSIGESLSTREAVSAGENFSNMRSTAKNIAERNHVDVDDAFRGLVNFSQGASFNASASISGKIPIVNIGEGKLGLDGKISAEHTRTSESATRHGIGKSIDVTAEEAQRFSNDLHKVEEYSKTNHADTSHSTADSQLSQLSTDLRNARSASKQHAIHKTESERLSNAASYVRQHSGQIDSDLGQEIANYTVKKDGREEAETLFAGKNRPKLEARAREYISVSGIESSIMSKYQQDSSGINPEKKYQSEEAAIEAEARDLSLVHDRNKQAIDYSAKAEGVGVDQQQYEQLTKKIEAKNKEVTKKVNSNKLAQDGSYSNLESPLTR